MTKNIVVVDENGKEYEATYPKRAKGLVKNGRAHFIDENTICLLCPPDIELEDKPMSENIAENNIETMTEKYTLDYCLEQIEKIQAQLTDLKDPLFTIQTIREGADCDAENESESAKYDGDVARDKARAVREIFFEREQTLNRLLGFYEKMYEDLKPKAAMDTEEKIALLEKIMSVLPREIAIDSNSFMEILSTIHGETE